MFVKAGPPTPNKRTEICSFIVNSLRAYMGEPPIDGGIKLYALYRTHEERELLVVALHSDSPNRFKEKVLEKELLDNSIRFTQGWSFEFILVQDLTENYQFRNECFALDFIESQKETVNEIKPLIAKIKINDGQATQNEYILEPAVQIEYTIGRELSPRLENGFVRQNNIAFLGQKDPKYDRTKDSYSLSVSRNHASIKYNSIKNKYYLYVDEGGLPSQITKIKRGELIMQLVLLDVPYELMSGDKILLGEGANITFLEHIVDTLPYNNNITVAEELLVRSREPSVLFNEEEIDAITLSENLPFHFIIIDTNIWIDIDPRCSMALESLLKVCEIEGVKIKLLSKVYEEIQKKLGDYSKNDIYVKQISRTKSAIVKYIKSKVILIDEIPFIHDASYSRYADPQIAKSFMELLEQGKKALLITNDNDLSIRVLSNVSTYHESQYQLLNREELINLSIKLKNIYI